MHLRNQLIKPNLWGEMLKKNYHMNSYLLKLQYAKFHEKIFVLGVDFDQYFRSEYSIQNQYSHRNIGQKINPKSRYFFMKFSRILYKHIFYNIAQRNYEFAPKFFVHRLILI